MLGTFLSAAVTYLREFSEVAVLGFVFGGILQAVLNPGAVARYLGKGVVWSNLLGATIGVVTPLCCCSSIPTALTLYRSGSRRGPACAFLIATPWFNWYGLTSLVIFLGWHAALAVALSAVVIAFGTGVLIDVFGAQQAVFHTLGVQATTGSCSSCAAPATTARLFDLSDPPGKLWFGLRHACDQVRELAPWIAAGILMGAAVETFVPERIITQYLGGASLLGLLAALAVAGIYSADSLGMLPWVQSLLNKGLGSGSAMVLLVAGVGTNVSTLGPVARAMGRRAALLYAMGVVVLSALLGFLLNLGL